VIGDLDSCGSVWSIFLSFMRFFFYFGIEMSICCKLSCNSKIVEYVL
jgi:hypothetical protein